MKPCGPSIDCSIGDIGSSNALKIARHLRLPEHVVARAESYLAQSRTTGVADWEVLQRLRKEAEAAREARSLAQAEAERTREALGRASGGNPERIAKGGHDCRGARALQPGDRVVVPRLGYDRPGRLVKLDPRKKTAVVAIGHVTWNVAIDELIPQEIRDPSSTGPQNPRLGSRNPAARPRRLA